MTGHNGRLRRGIALTVLGFAVCAAAPVQDADQKTITLVHLSDVHMRPGFNAPERFRLALRDVRSRKPALIINTGDTVDGSAEADAKWASWQAAVTAEIRNIPLYNLLGNHDIDEPLTREIACARLGMPSRYYRFDRFGWRFLMLDGNGFAADKEQWDWLVRELQEAPTRMPIVVASHHPVFSMGATIHSPGDQIGRWKELVALFARHPNVKLCLGGHSHLADVTRYNGVTYTSGGSVSGYWWELVKSSDGKGSYQETPPGYNVIRLAPFGVISVDYVRYPDPATR